MRLLRFQETPQKSTPKVIIAPTLNNLSLQCTRRPMEISSLKLKRNKPFFTITVQIPAR